MSNKKVFMTLPCSEVLGPPWSPSDFQSNCFTAVGLAECQCTEFLNRQCISIQVPYVLAQIAGSCVDQQHQVVASNCFDVSTNYTAHVSVYESYSGIVISGSKRDDLGWGYTQAPPTVEERCIALKEGYDFHITRSTASKLYRTANTTYSLDIYVSPPPSLPPMFPPSPPPPR